VRAPLPPLTILKTYYLISPDFKIVLTTLHKGEGGGAKTIVTGGRGPINCSSQQFLHAIVGVEKVFCGRMPPDLPILLHTTPHQTWSPTTICHLSTLKCSMVPFCRCPLPHCRILENVKYFRPYTLDNHGQKFLWKVISDT
jgi:hypothetical protein